MKRTIATPNLRRSRTRNHSATRLDVMWWCSAHARRAARAEGQEDAELTTSDGIRTHEALGRAAATIEK